MATCGVIIPVYNAEQHLKKCLDSVAQQTYKDFLAILINDGSSDKSGEICDDYAKNDSRFIVKHTVNQGVSSARNIGLDFMTARDDIKYISFIDSDDYIDEHMFETMIASMQQIDSDISVCNIINVVNDEIAGGGGISLNVNSLIFSIRNLYIGFSRI